MNLSGGDMNPSTTQLYYSISHAYTEVRQISIAMIYLKKSATMIQFMYGKHHIQTAISYSSLAQLSYANSDFKAAVEN
jgi:hypothetical protein